MLGERLENGLVNPPNRIGNQFVTLRPIEAVGRGNQPEIAGTTSYLINSLAVLS